jgi:hypothetical protein
MKDVNIAAEYASSYHVEYELRPVTKSNGSDLNIGSTSW